MIRGHCVWKKTKIKFTILKRINRKHIRILREIGIYSERLLSEVSGGLNPTQEDNINGTGTEEKGVTNNFNKNFIY